LKLWISQFATAKRSSRATDVVVNGAIFLCNRSSFQCTFLRDSHSYTLPARNHSCGFVSWWPESSYKACNWWVSAGPTSQGNYSIWGSKDSLRGLSHIQFSGVKLPPPPPWPHSVIMTLPYMQRLREEQCTTIMFDTYAQQLSMLVYRELQTDFCDRICQWGRWCRVCKT
jgi:hypothetical protein